MDDEEKSRKDLKMLLELYCNDVSVTGEASSIEEATVRLQSETPNLLFLDIEMGDGSGFQLLKYNAACPFHVILVTAHSHYAIKAFRYAAVDYLLKPIDVDDLVAAVEKVRQICHAPRKTRSIDNEHYLELRVSDGVVYVPFHDIIRLQAEGSYTIVHLANSEKHYLSNHIGYYETRLNNQYFFRVHKSHLVNLKHVKKILRSDGYYVQMTDGSKAEVSRRQKNEFLLALKDVKS